MLKYLILVLLLVSCSKKSSQVPDLEVPKTLGIQTKADNCTAKDLDQLKEIGVSFIRKGFYWYQIEKVKGTYDFSVYDRLLNDSESRGIRVYGCLYGSNESYENDGLGGIQTEAGRKGFANFAAETAKHFSGRNIIWEIWNEPNIGSFWRKGEHNTEAFADEYTSLVKETVQAMRAADPDCFVVAGAVSGLWDPSFKWMTYCFDKGILKSGINGWSVHPYSFRTPEEHAQGYRKLRELLDHYNLSADYPLFNSERGYTVDTLRKEGWSGGLEEKASEYMAWHLVRQYLIDLMNDIRLTVYYEWKGKEFGVVWNDEKRPAYFACTNLVKQLKGFTLKKRIDTGSANDYILLFENRDGHQKIVGWTAPLANKTPEQTRIHSIEIPVATKTVPSCWDLYGKEIPVNITNGKITLELSGSPQYVSLTSEID